VKAGSDTPVPIKVLLAEDHRVMRNAVARLLSGDSEIEVVAVATNFAQLLEYVPAFQPDVVIMDVHMHDDKFVEPERIKAVLTRSRLLAMSIWKDEETKLLADRLGAVALLDKPNLGRELITAIKRCAALAPLRRNTPFQV
jgi:DNA-binding NarL/FixJ family response regulator